MRRHPVTATSFCSTSIDQPCRLLRLANKGLGGESVTGYHCAGSRAWRNGRRKGLKQLSALRETRGAELPKLGETCQMAIPSQAPAARTCQGEGVETRRAAPNARTRYGEGIVQTTNKPTQHCARRGGESRSWYENPSARKSCAGSSPAARTTSSAVRRADVAIRADFGMSGRWVNASGTGSRSISASP
jgi:hypothetical protein